MIPSPDSSPSVMLGALAHTRAALDAAIELDVDRTEDDRAAMKADASLVAEQRQVLAARVTAHEDHEQGPARVAQARVEVGDAVLDRGVSKAKARTKVEAGIDAADHAFRADVSELTGAPQRKEPALVLAAAEKLAQIADFPGKEAVRTDLVARADRQLAALAERDKTDLTGTTIRADVVRAVADASEFLYKIEKRLLERFPRDRRYVATFFPDGRRRTPKSEPTE